jgi:FKBP-type peptidyl-prolyl cis-trans isomerase (trigger factor)
VTSGYSENLNKFEGAQIHHEELDAAVMEFFESIPQEQWLEAFKRWQDRMQRVLDNAGNYIIHFSVINKIFYSISWRRKNSRVTLYF